MFNRHAVFKTPGVIHDYKNSLVVEVVVQQLVHARDVLGGHGSESILSRLRRQLQRLDVVRQCGLGRQGRKANLTK